MKRFCVSSVRRWYSSTSATRSWTRRSLPTACNTRDVVTTRLSFESQLKFLQGVPSRLVPTIPIRHFSSSDNSPYDFNSPDLNERLVKDLRELHPNYDPATIRPSEMVKMLEKIEGFDGDAMKWSAFKNTEKGFLCLFLLL